MAGNRLFISRRRGKTGRFISLEDQRAYFVFTEMKVFMDKEIWLKPKGHAI